MERCLFYVSYLLFQVLKKKQKGTGTLAAVSRTPQRFKVSVKLRCVAPATLFLGSEKINACFLIVGSFVLGCMRYFLFSSEEKRSKKGVGDYYRDCVPG